jgi:hypothetical protein
MSDIVLGFYQFNLLVGWLLPGLLLISIPAGGSNDIKSALRESGVKSNQAAKK